MKKIAFYDTKPYDKVSFNRYQNMYEIIYFEEKLSKETTHLATGYDGVIAFVNDLVDKDTINGLFELGIKVIALRCAGFNNVDVRAAYKKINILRVPEYSPYAVAEHAFALLLAINRKVHKAYIRTKEFNFNINGLTGFDMHGKTLGVIGTGKIGRVFVNIAKGFGMNVIAYDPFPDLNLDIAYLPIEELFQKSDIIALHCPLTKETQHMINEKTISQMKDGVYIINTSRGGVIDSHALLKALKSEKVKGAALDVYEEEASVFFEDFSTTVINDDTLSLLLAQPNVLITSHQAFLTEEALMKIAEVTIHNLNQFFSGEALENEICYLCLNGKKAKDCYESKRKRCF